MNVASQTLCNELYELSGWNEVNHYYVQHDDEYDLEYSTNMPIDGGIYPAYDIGYLLRKLPNTYYGYYLDLSTTADETWVAEYFTNDFTPERPMSEYRAEGFTPEDAAAKLAIQLIRAGLVEVQR